MDKQLAGLSQASQNKKQSALCRTEKAIAFLIENKQKITIRAVAREAEVSVSYIYKYPELAYKIQRLREEQRYSLSAPQKASKLDKEKTRILSEENKLMSDKIAELEAIIELIKSDKKSLKSLREENIQLATENVRLKKELEYTQQNLQAARKFILEQGHLDLIEAELEIKAVEADL